MRPKSYLTTPIYYVNDVPHIGHAYTTIAADALARYYRRTGCQVFFLTGTDEHGAKVAEAAASHGQSPKAYCDHISARFQDAWQSLNISNEFFIRTTDPLHEAGVQHFLNQLYATGDIYRGVYEGRYCVSCERFYAEEELAEGLCPDHRQPPVWYSEENYFFRLSKYQEVLIKALLDESDPNHYEVSPPPRRNEVLGKLRAGLSDISISRATLAWGIPLPFDPRQTTYVWVDALLNYITAIGYREDPASFARWWPADLHLVGKDILWFHAIIWPALLIAVGLPLPRLVFAHGFFTVEGQKMSKTLGNFIRPHELTAKFGVDATRYLVLAAFPFGTDGDISLTNFIERYNADLANDLGNLLNRTLAMINRYCDGAIPLPDPVAAAPVDEELRATAAGALAKFGRAMESLAFSDALAAVFQLVGRGNKYVEENAPWSLHKTDRRRLATVLYHLAEALRLIAHALGPIMPAAAAKLAAQLGVDLGRESDWTQATVWGGLSPGTRVTARPEPLFPKIEVAAR